MESHCNCLKIFNVFIMVKYLYHNSNENSYEMSMKTMYQIWYKYIATGIGCKLYLIIFICVGFDKWHKSSSSTFSVAISFGNNNTIMTISPIMSRFHFVWFSTHSVCVEDNTNTVYPDVSYLIHHIYIGNSF